MSLAPDYLLEDLDGVGAAGVVGIVLCYRFGFFTSSFFLCLPLFPLFFLVFYLLT